MRLGKRTSKLLREAILLAHVEGSQWGYCHKPTDEYPTDSEIVIRVLFASVVCSDLYPSLSKTDEAQRVFKDVKRRQMEQLALMIRTQHGDRDG